MSKVEKMSLSEIIEKTSLCLRPESIYDIWKKDAVPQKSMFNPKGTSALDDLSEEDFVTELISPNNVGKLSRFLFGHENEIDKEKLVLNMLRTYKNALEAQDLSAERRDNFKVGLEEAKKLLKDVDKTYIYYIRNEDTGRLDSLIIVNTKDEVEGRNRKQKRRNKERLEDLETQEDISDIIKYVHPEDFHNLISSSATVGREIKFMIEHNTALSKLDMDNESFLEMCTGTGFEEYIKDIKQEEFIPEMCEVIRNYFSELDIDKLLLCAASRYMDALEDGKIPEEDIAEVYKRLQVIQKHIKRNLKINILTSRANTIVYDSQTMAREMKKFVVTEEKIEFFTIEKCVELSNAIKNGALSLNSLKSEEFEALLFGQRDKDTLLDAFPSNYIFFLRQNKLPHSKERILKNIKNSNECPQELLKLLCEKTDITNDEIYELFEMQIISISDLNNIKENREDLLSDTKLFEKYVEYRDSKEEDKENTRIQLERYALAYRNMHLQDKTEKEIAVRGEKFIENVGDDIQARDLIPLYGFDVLPLNVAVDWGGEEIIDKLLQNETLKPSDAKYLRDKGLLDENVLERLFKNNRYMSYAYQVALVCTVFDGQTQEEQEIKEKLAQYYHIENGMINSANKAFAGKRRSVRTNDTQEEERKVKMRDPGAKYNLLSAIDNGVKIEQGIIDGHIIFHYPNIGEGTVLIEKLHKITNNRETGLIEIKADNSSATYIISEEEFIKIKSNLIQEGKIDRTQLTQRWFREPGYWVAHIGKDSWERGIKERFDITSKNPRYSSVEDLSKMEELLQKSAQSKDIEDR